MTEEQATAIDVYMAECQQHCETALASLRKVRADHRTPAVNGLIQYWKNARGAFKWAAITARQKARSNARQPIDPIQ